MKKELIVYSERVEAKLYPPARGMVDEFNFVVRADGGRFEYEFGVKLIELGGGLTVEVSVFGDALKAFRECREVFDLLANHHDAINSREMFLSLLPKVERLGWERKIPNPDAYNRPCRCGEMHGYH